MIITRLCGGLGNQLFQYSAGRRLSQKLQTELVLDLDWYVNKPSSNTPRGFELHHYPIHARLATPAEQRWFALHNRRLVSRLPFIPRRWSHRREKGFHFDPDIIKLTDDTYIDGYWQSYRYFDDIADVVRQELTPRVPLSPADERVGEQIMGSSSAVAVHVRRGDYVSNPAAARVHGVCSQDYYARALSLVAGKIPAPRFFIFSDDLPWVRNHLTFPGVATYVDHNTAETAFQDLRLMSLCRHHIVANSSFSWWAAWLCTWKEKLTVAPLSWFVDGRDTRDLIPPQWIRI